MIPSSPLLDLYAARSELGFWQRHFYSAAFNPLPRQAAFLSSRAKIAVYSGGNRAGKTEVGAVKAALLANGVLGLLYPGFPDDGRPTKGLVSGLDYKLVSKVLRPKLQRALGRSVHSWSEKNQMWRLKNGSEIWLASEESGEQKYQAIDIDWAWKDEFGDAKSEGIINEIMRGLVDRNGCLFVTATPTLGASWAGPLWYEPWRDATGDTDGQIHYCSRPGHCSANGVTFYFVNTEDNAYLSRDAVKDWIARQVTEEQKAVRLHGRFVTLEGLVYPMFDLSRHVIDSIPIPKEWQKWRGMDFGLAAPSTCLWAALEPAVEGRGPRLHIYREVYDTRQGKTVQMTSQLIKDASNEEEYVQTLLDPSCWNRDPAPEAVGGFFVVADEYARCGVYAERANNEVESGVERLWRYLGAPGTVPSLVIHRCCENLVREMRRQKWKKGITGLTQTPGWGMGDKIDKTDSDHALDALRYIVMAGPLEADTFYGPDKDDYDSSVEGPEEAEWVLDAQGRPALKIRRRISLDIEG